MNSTTIIISHPTQLETKKQAIAKAGKEKLHVLADFDRTLTKGYVNGKKEATVIARLPDSGLLGPEYKKKAYDLFHKYRPIETDPKLTREEKIPIMREWWIEHARILVEHGLSLDVMRKAIAMQPLHFREGSLAFIDYLYEQNIPLVILSAGPREMIAMALEREGRLYDNVHVIGYRYEYDKRGNCIGIKEPIIHSMNKKEIVLKGFPVYEHIKNHKNVILLGDTLEDTHMIDGFEYENVIKVALCGEKECTPFEEVYDAIIPNDGPMTYLLQLLKELFP